MAKKLLTRDQLKATWKAISFLPNNAQQDAIFADFGPVLVTAGPGSGKTRVLLHRVAYLVAVKGVDPAKIFLSTFTEKAANQLEEGIRFLLGQISRETGHRFNPSNMYVGTTHALCGRMLGELRVDASGKRQPSLHPMDQFEQYRLIQRNWKALSETIALDPEKAAEFVTGAIVGKPTTSRHRAAQAAASFFNRMAEEMITAADGKAKALRGSAKLFQLYAAYEDLLASSSRTDLSRLQLDAFKRLRVAGPSAGRLNFEHVIIDEYQDTNPVQEKIFFELAKRTGNLMVVGDDDQALYRFRGATVENLLRFEARCKVALKKAPLVVNLDVNYRSRPEIVDLYRDFMIQHDWSSSGKPAQSFRMPGKKLRANEPKKGASVACTEKGTAANVAEETAEFVKKLIESKKVSDPNEIAFLFPSVKSKTATMMKTALERRGIGVYAPRASKFLDGSEPKLVYGLLIFFLRRCGNIDQHRDPVFEQWLNDLEKGAKAAAIQHKDLALLLKDVVDEAQSVIARDQTVLAACEAIGLSDDTVLDAKALDKLAAGRALGSNVSARLKSIYLRNLIRKRAEEGRPYKVASLRRFLCSLDWGLLDLFYRLLSVGPFAKLMSDTHLAQDEAGAFNLALVSKQLAAFQEEGTAVLSARDLSMYTYRSFAISYLYALWRSEEGEVEDEEQVFPAGRVPFLTIHQSKGLEFPIVVLGTTTRRNLAPGPLEQLARVCTGRDNEPEDRISTFDSARLFYVAFSRARDLLVVARPKGQGQSTFAGLDSVLDKVPTRVSKLNPRDLGIRPNGKGPEYNIYSYTGDYLSYQLCARQYMVFRRYGFAASRSQTIVFGSLVHRVIEEIHRDIIDARVKP